MRLVQSLGARLQVHHTVVVRRTVFAGCFRAPRGSSWVGAPTNTFGSRWNGRDGAWAERLASLTYLARWGMHHAAQRLKYSTDTVGTIAREVGYTSEYAFNRAFARYRGQPPGR